MRRNLEDWWMCGPWYYVNIGLFDDLKNKCPYKLIRLLIAIVGFVWFVLLIPLTLISLAVFVLIDAWRDL